jgi:hypothetical protein
MRKIIVVLVLVIIISLLELPGQGITVHAAPPQLDLRAFPVIPSIAGAVGWRASYLARRGKRYGNRPDVFSKLGDSITRWTYFLAPVGLGQVQLGQYVDLQPAVAYFSRRVARTNNSFANESLGAHDRWTAADLLNSAWATPGVCLSGETPVACELRATRPSIALIMIGTNDLVDNNLAAFQANLNMIVSITESYSVIPVISTIPYRRDNPILQTRVDAFNQVIVSVALAHQAPIWNYWLAVEGLPANGVSIDGIHPSIPPDNGVAVFDPAHLQFGFPMRNLTALQVLKTLMPLVQ